MSIAVFLASSAMAIATVGLGRFLIPIGLKGLAENDIFFTLPPEMKGLVVVRGNEFHHAARCAQHKRVGNSHRAQEARVHDQREGRQRQLGADELREHLVHVGDYSLQKFALRPCAD